VERMEIIVVVGLVVVDACVVGGLS